MEPGSPEFNKEILSRARRAFPQYYALANAYELQIVDAIVIGHAAMSVVRRAPRDHISGDLRNSVDTVTNSTDHMFMAMVSMMRACSAFHAISQAERDAIEGTLFKVP